LNELAKTAL